MKSKLRVGSSAEQGHLRQMRRRQAIGFKFSLDYCLLGLACDNSGVPGKRKDEE
jgi:hypothetical protein